MPEPTEDLRISFSFDTNVEDFNDIFAFKDITRCTNSEKSMRIIRSDMENDAALSIVYKHLSSIVDITDSFRNINDTVLNSNIELSSSTVFSLPTGFEVHHCPVLANSDNILGRRSNYKPDRVQQNNISAMFLLMILPDVVENITTSLSDVTQFSIIKDLLDSTTLSVGIDDIIPTIVSELNNHPIIDSSSIMTFFLEFSSILEKLKYLACNVYYKKTMFGGKMIFHNTLNVYPELPAVSDLLSNCFYSAVLASPMSKYYSVDMNDSAFLKLIKTLDTVSPVNQIALNRLIYVGTDFVDYSTFSLDTFDGTNGKAEVFANITTSSYDIRSLIPDIISMFSLHSGNIINLKNVRNAILYIFDLWQRNILTFLIDIYACHYNCHLNSFVDSDVDDYKIIDYYYSISHNIMKSTFPDEYQDLIDIKGQQTSYLFSSSRTLLNRRHVKVYSEEIAKKTEIYYDGKMDRVPITMTYPYYTGADPDIVIPVKIECQVDKIYSSDSASNTKTIKLSEIYYLTKNSNKVDNLFVQDLGLDSTKIISQGKDIKGIIEAENFRDLNNTISCVGNITFKFSYAKSGIIKEYFLKTGDIKNTINIKTNELIDPGYIYDVNENTALYVLPNYINMTYRDPAYDYSYQYTPRVVGEINNYTIEQGEISVYYHYDSNPRTVGDPGFYTRLSNYISVDYDREGNPIDSILIADEDIFEYDKNSDDGSYKLDDYGQRIPIGIKPGIKPLFDYSYENSTHVTENAIVTLIPVPESKFGGYLDVSYEIKQLKRLSFTDSNITWEWSGETLAEIGDYTLGSGPFEPIPILYETNEDGDLVEIDSSMYEITYENNNPTTDITLTMKTIVSPSLLSYGKYGEVFYTGDPLELTCSLKPLPNEDIGEIGIYQGNLMGSNSLHKYTENSWKYYGTFIDWDGKATSPEWCSISPYKEGYKADKPDDVKYRCQEFENTISLPTDIKQITIKIFIGRPWDGTWGASGAKCFGINSFEIPGTSVTAIDIYTKVFRDYMFPSDKYASVYERTITLKVPSPDPGKKLSLVSRSNLMDPNITAARFVAMSVWYDSPETRLQHNIEKGLEKTLNFLYVVLLYEKNKKDPILDNLNAYTTWINSSDRNFAYGSFSPKSGKFSEVLSDINGSIKISSKFNKISRVYISYKDGNNTIKKYNVGWKISVNSSDNRYKTEYIVKYTKYDSSKNDQSISWPSISSNLWYSSTKSVFLDIINSIPTNNSITLKPLMVEDFDNQTTVIYTVEGDSSWISLPNPLSNFSTKTLLNEERAKEAWGLILSQYAVNNDMDSNVNSPSKKTTYCKGYKIEFRFNAETATDKKASGDYPDTEYHSELKVVKSAELAGDTTSIFTVLVLTPLKDPLDNEVTLTSGDYPVVEGVEWTKITGAHWVKTKRGLQNGRYSLPRAQYKYNGRTYFCIGWTGIGKNNGTVVLTINEIQYSVFDDSSNDTEINISTSSFSRANEFTEVIMIPLLSYSDKILSCNSPTLPTAGSNCDRPWKYDESWVDEDLNPKNPLEVVIASIAHSSLFFNRASYETWIADETEENGGHLETIYNIGWKMTIYDPSPREISLYYDNRTTSSNSSTISQTSLSELELIFHSSIFRRDVNSEFSLEIITDKDTQYPEYNPKPEPELEPKPEPEPKP